MLRRLAKKIANAMSALRRVFSRGKGRPSRPDVGGRGEAPRDPGYHIIEGKPGAGKTAMLTARARAEMAAGRRVLVVASSERVAAEIKSSGDYDPERHLIASQRGVCLAVIPPARHPALAAKEDIIGEALTALDTEMPRRLYPTVLVDETQNLSPDFLRVVDRLTDPDHHTTTYFLDPSKAIFGFAGAGIPTIALVRSRAGNRMAHLSRGRRPVATASPDIHTTDVITTAADIATSLLTATTEVGILTRTNAEAAEIAGLLSRRGTPHRHLTARLLAASNPAEGYAGREADLAPPTPGQIFISTIHTGADRVWDHVVVLDTGQPAADLIAYRRLINTGLTRGRVSARAVVPSLLAEVAEEES